MYVASIIPVESLGIPWGEIGAPKKLIGSTSIAEGLLPVRGAAQDLHSTGHVDFMALARLRDELDHTYHTDHILYICLGRSGSSSGSR